MDCRVLRDERRIAELGRLRALTESADERRLDFTVGGGEDGLTLDVAVI